jgi:hypothetical protein
MLFKYVHIHFVQTPAPEKLPVCQLVLNKNHNPTITETTGYEEKLLTAYGTRSSLPCPQETATVPYPEPDNSNINSHPISLAFPSGILTEILCISCISHARYMV